MVELLDPNKILGNCAPKPNVLNLDQMLLFWHQKDVDAMRYIIRVNPNVGSSFFPFRTHPKWVVRSAQLADNELCYKHLISQYDIRNVINLYDHSFQSSDQIEKELRIFKTHKPLVVYTRVAHFSVWTDTQTQEALFNDIDMIVNQIALAQGNVHLHCYQGMHETGVIFGILQKCIQHAPDQEVVATYQRYCAYIDQKQPGFSEDQNIRAILAYPCERIKHLVEPKP
jgi:hypothetical protein